MAAGDAGGAAPTARELAARSARAAKLLEATLNHRRTTMRYLSMSSDREKEYVIEPYRLVFAQGGLYLVAYVPEYRQLRTFAVDRIRGMSLHEERFNRPTKSRRRRSRTRSACNRARRRRHIEIAFEPRIARYVRERLWHASQQAEDQPDGGVALALQV